MKQLGKVIALAGLAISLAFPAMGIDPADKCEASKLKEAGKYNFCRMKAEMKAVKKGELPDYSKCEAKLAIKWGVIESKGGCAKTGDLDSERAELTGDTVAAKWRISDGERFIDNGDGTITDRKTNLMWERKVKLDGAQDLLNTHDADTSYKWALICQGNGDLCQPDAPSATACAQGVEGDPEGCTWGCSDFSTCGVPGQFTIWQWLGALNDIEMFAGHQDWRIPTTDELSTLVDLSLYDPAVDSALHDAFTCGVACTDVTDPSCGCTASSNYWSSTSDANDPTNAWFVDFGGGGVSLSIKANSRRVRAVRGGL